LLITVDALWSFLSGIQTTAYTLLSASSCSNHCIYDHQEPVKDRLLF